MEDEKLPTCSFYVTRKKRFCKVPTFSGKKFCPHHMHLDSEDNGSNIRVPCPFDSKHYCYLSKLEKHKKKCNAREKEQPSYYKRNVNSVISNSPVSKIGIDDVSNEELVEVINKVENIHEACIEIFQKNSSLHPFLEEEIKNPNSAFSKKHLLQQASLLGLLELNSLLKDSTCFIEFGAGKGQLMYWIVKVLTACPEKKFVLIDRAAQRYKMDNKFKEDPNIQIERFRIDIQHLYLGEINSIKSNPEKVTGVSKHLCGAATDFALKCLMETIVVKNEEKEIKKSPLGLVMSMCCHHRCNWDVYVGKNFMLRHGFTIKEFKIMCIISSWATCGLRKKSNTENFEVHDEETVSNEIINRYDILGLSHSKREEIGKKCKHLIDMGRVEYLRHLGLSTNLYTYVEPSISLENVALVAVQR